MNNPPAGLPAMQGFIQRWLQRGEAPDLILAQWEQKHGVPDDAAWQEATRLAELGLHALHNPAFFRQQVRLRGLLSGEEPPGPNTTVRFVGNMQRMSSDGRTVLNEQSMAFDVVISWNATVADLEAAAGEMCDELAQGSSVVCQSITAIGGFGLEYAPMQGGGP